MYQLYIAHKNYSSWSLRPWILMKELGIAFDEHVYQFQPDGASNWDEFRTFSPTGKVPCLKLDELVVWDSLGITEFLAERHPQIWPDDPVVRAWARCATAEMHSGFAALRNICSMNCSIRVQLDEISPALQSELTRLDELLSEGLKHFGGPFLAGQTYTAVDAFYAPVVVRIKTYGLTLSDAVMTYVEYIWQRPHLQDWIKAGHLEPREEMHEADCVKYGRLVSDVRG